VIIDSPSPLVAPPAFNSTWTSMESAGAYGGHQRNAVADEELIAAADRQIALVDAVGTDLQLTSPRPYTLMQEAIPDGNRMDRPTSLQRRHSHRARLMK
jgi:4-oxalmesaconate hydratase